MDLYRLPHIFSFKTNQKGIEQVKEIEKNESVGGDKKGEFKKRSRSNYKTDYYPVFKV